MQTVLIALHLIIVLALIGTVLLQRSEGGLGLGGGGGGGVSGFMTGRGQANALTRATAILAALFFVTSISLAILAHRGAQPRSILDGGATPATTQPGTPQAPANADNLLDSMRQQGNVKAPPSAPTAPSAPAPNAPTPGAPEAPQPR